MHLVRNQLKKQPSRLYLHLVSLHARLTSVSPSTIPNRFVIFIDLMCVLSSWSHLDFVLFDSILKSIEFPHLTSTADDDQDVDKSDKVSTSVSAGGNKPLEVLLLERNKALQSENTALKVANSELQGKTNHCLFFRRRFQVVAWSIDVS